MYSAAVTALSKHPRNSAHPNLRLSGLFAQFDNLKRKSAFNSSPDAFLRLRSGAAGRARGNVGVTGAQRVTNPTESLAGAMLLLDHPETHPPVALLAQPASPPDHPPT